MGAIVTATLLGSAAVTLAVGLLGSRFSRRRILLAATGLMVATGLGFAGVTTFWPLLVVALVGTLNPSAGDVSVFLPTEQAALAAHRERPGPYDDLRLVQPGRLAGRRAGRARRAAFPAIARRARAGYRWLAAERGVFLVYAACAVVSAVIYRTLSPALEVHPASSAADAARRVPRRRARVWPRCSASTRSAAASWSSRCWCCGCYRRFHLDAGATAVVFLAAGRWPRSHSSFRRGVAARIGLVRTMVYTHLPANVFLVLAGADARRRRSAIAFLLAAHGRLADGRPGAPGLRHGRRAARGASRRVERHQRAAEPRRRPDAADRRRAARRTSFGWPLIIGGALKAAYDIVLLVQFRAFVPRESGIR